MYLSFRHIPFSRGRSKLNIYLFEEDWQSAITEIECHPHEAKVWTTRPGFFNGDNESNVLPIHVACSLHAPIEVIRAIVEAYPEGVQAVESAYKRLPIHIACQFAARTGVIEYLVEQYVAGTMEADILGRLPLHYACSNGAPLCVVNTLLKVNKASTLYQDMNGWIPLHVAVHFGSETAVIKEILVVSPCSIVNVTTKRGNSAMSLAKKISWKNKEEVLALLDNANQERSFSTDFLKIDGPCGQRKQPLTSRYVPYAA